MANYLSQKLSNAIRDHAYAKGEFQKQTGIVLALKSEQQQKEKRLLEIQELLVVAQQNRDEAYQKLLEAERRMNGIAPQLDTKKIRAVRETPKIGGLKWGQFKRELIELLIANPETALPTDRFMELFAEKYAVPIDTPQQRDSLRQRILRRLEEMAEKGLVQRRRETTGMRKTYWLWIGMD